MGAGREVSISLDGVRDKNVMQLKKLNTALFPVRYNDKYYADALASGDFTKLGLYTPLFLFFYIYMCVCVCVCVFSLFFFKFSVCFFFWFFIIDIDFVKWVIGFFVFWLFFNGFVVLFFVLDFLVDFFGCFWDFSQFVKVFLLLKMLYESRILINCSRLWLLSVGCKSTKCWFFESLLLSITGGSE